MGKQMEGDNRERRKRVKKKAAEKGQSASAAGVTLGASKQDYSLGRQDDHIEKMEAPGRGQTAA